MKTKQTKQDFEFKMMMREDNFEVLTKCAPKASHRLIEIIAEGYNADFPDDAALAGHRQSQPHKDALEVALQVQIRGLQEPSTQEIGAEGRKRRLERLSARM